MAVTNQQIIDYLLYNPNLSDAQIVAAMEQNGVSPAQMASAVNLPEGQIASRVAATVPNGNTVTLGDTIVQPVYQVSGSGQDQQIGGLENVITYKASDNKTGGAYTQYTPTGEVEKTGTQQEVKSGLKEFALGAGLLLGLPTLLNAGAGALGTTTFAGEALADATLLSGGSNAGLFSGVGSTLGNAAGSIGSTLGNAAGSIGTTLGNAAGTVGSTLGNIGSTIGTTLGTAGTNLLTNVGTGIGTNLLTGVGTKLAGDAITGGLGLTGSVLQQQQSREAAQTAAQNIDRATQQAVEASQFRPVGMTTRFGTSNYTYDPVTGRMTSAGYQLSPDAKAAQDRLVALAGQGLTQAEAAQAQFAPLQTGAQNLFGLGNQYISQSPQDVAQNYHQSTDGFVATFS
jgi:hypothetical protein